MSYQKELIQVAAVAIAALQDFNYGSTKLDEDTDEGFLYLETLLDEIREERRRQEAKWGPQTHDPMKWMVILMEEVGETAEAYLEKDYG